MSQKSSNTEVFNIKKGTILKTKVREDDVYNAIYDAVMDHRLQPGTKLTEASFSNFFGVSRTVIRKALFRLGQKNIVEIRPNRGAIIACPSIEETRDVFMTRKIIEHAIMVEVVNCITKNHLKQLKKHIAEENKASKNGDRRTVVRLSGEFHILLASLQPNRILSQFLNELVTRTTLIVALYEAPGSPGCANHDHKEIIDFIANNELEKAIDSMNEHLLEIESKLNLVETSSSIDLSDVFGN